MSLVAMLILLYNADTDFESSYHWRRSKRKLSAHTRYVGRAYPHGHAVINGKSSSLPSGSNSGESRGRLTWSSRYVIRAYSFRNAVHRSQQRQQQADYLSRQVCLAEASFRSATKGSPQSDRKKPPMKNARYGSQACVTYKN